MIDADIPETVSREAFIDAISVLNDIERRSETDPEVANSVKSIVAGRESVLPRFQPIFARDNLDNLREEDFRDFLIFKNNRHWKRLQRMGPSICADMELLRSGLKILLDEERPLTDRLNELVPTRGAAYVPRLSRAVLTPILLVAHPDRYGVWNNVSEAAMRSLDIWPEFERGMPFGDRYEKVNDIMLAVSAASGFDLWTLDALWWRLGQTDEPGGEDIATEEAELDADSSRFGLERHLHEFLRDNWEHTTLGKDWQIYEEDGDPEAGYEYPCAVGRIDLLAKHRTDARWLVIELKRNQSSDKTVGQVLRYVGWVKQHLADQGDEVDGLVIAHKADDTIRYALSVTHGVELQLYEVQFSLRGVPPI